MTTTGKPSSGAAADRLVRRRRDALADEREAVGSEQAARRGRVEPRLVVVRERLRDDLPRRRRRRRRSTGGTRAGRAPQPLAVLGCAAEGGRGGLGIGERGDRGRAERSVAGAPLAARIDREHGLVGLVRRGGRPADRRADVGRLDGGGGTKRAITESMPGSARSSGSARSKLSAVAEPSMSTGFASDASAGSDGRERGARLLAERGQLEPGGLAGVRAEDPEPAGVRQHGHASALRDGLATRGARRRRGGPTSVSARITPAWRKTASTAVSEPASAAVWEPAAFWPARERPLFIASTGFSPREPARDARELARVAERLEVEQDEVGARVVLPPLEEVVGRDVGLVADRDEGGEAEPARLGALEEGKAERARLRGEADPPCGERPWREGRVQPDRRGRDPEAVRADEPGAVRADEREQLLLALDALGPRLGEAGGDDAERARPGAERLLGGADHVLAREADHAEVDRVGDLLERRGRRVRPRRARPSG